MAGLQAFQGIVVTLMIIGILVGATMLALVSFKDSIGTDACAARSDGYTTYSGGLCSNGTATVHPSTAAFNGTVNWVDAGGNLSSKAPTAGTLFGIGLIIVAVFGGIFLFMGKGSNV